MRWRPDKVADVVFWLFFGPYVGGLLIWLLVGLAPAAVNAMPTLHRALHDRGGDALRAGTSVVLDVENADTQAPHGFRVEGAAGVEPVFRAEPVDAGGTASFRFVAPVAGSYRMVGDDGTPRDEIRFTEDGGPSLRLRIDGDRFEKLGRDRWARVAQRIADASHRGDHGARVAMESVFSALNLGLGVLLLVRRPRDRAAQLLALAMAGTAATFNHQSHSVLNLSLIGNQEVLHLLFHLTSGLAYMYAVIVFPDGRLVPSWPSRTGRSVVRALYACFTLLITAVVLLAASESHPGQPFFTILFGLLVPLAGFAAQTQRLRQTSDPVARQQSRLLRWALVPMLSGGVVYLALTAVLGPDVEDLGPGVFPALFAMIPIALVVGILRYRLWDIDVIISKTLLSLGLAGFIGAVYVGVVVLLGSALETAGPTTGLQIAATAIAAVAFEPVRARLQRFSNRLVYGQRATPYEVMADFSRRVAGGLSVDQVLPSIAKATGRGIEAVATSVSVLLPGGESRTVSWPPEAGEATPSTRKVPVVHGGQAVGEIAVTKAAGDDLTAAEDELLAALAAQAGLAFNNVRLAEELHARLEDISSQAADLRASRQRIVTSREGLRQRVVGAIHDRVEVRLEAIEATLIEVERTFGADPQAALRQLDAVTVEAGDALDALRDLARGIFPPLLADRGVLGALEAHASKASLSLRIDIDGLAAGQRFDPQAEASVFFCLVEALHDARHRPAGGPVAVRLAAGEGRLAFEVADTGPGIGRGGPVTGPDLQGMRDRVEAVGGELEVRSSPGQPLVVSGWVPARSLVGVAGMPSVARVITTT